MHNAVEFVSFNLKEGASAEDFLLASDKMNDGFLAKQKGYVSRKLLVKDEIWADWVLWETMDDALNAADAFGKNEADCEYMSFIENCSMSHFLVEKSY